MRLYANAELLRAMDAKVLEQIANVARLPGLVGAAMTMPDAHWGYGFPIGGVAAFDAEQGGIVSAGGVGFDISCGVRTLLHLTSTRCARAAPGAARRRCFAHSRRSSAARATQTDRRASWMR